MDKRRRRIVAIVVAVVLASVSLGAYWYVALRPLTIEEVLDWDGWYPGDSRVLYGRVTRAELVNTSFGSALFVTLDDHRWCTPTIIADPAAGIRVGDSFRTTLHFTEVRLNGLAGVWAPEIACLLPGYLFAMQVVADVISLYGGFLLLYRGTGSGWSVFEVLTAAGDRYEADRLPVSLRQASPVSGAPPNSGPEWAEYLGVEYVRFSGWYSQQPEIDTMSSLSARISQNGRVEFVDVNAIGFLDDGDEIRVRVDPSLGAESYGTYFLDVGRTEAQPNGSYVSGIKLLIVNGQGTYQWPIPVDRTSVVHLRHAGDVVGTTVASNLSVSDVRWGPPLASSEYTFTLQAGADVTSAAVADLPVMTPSGIRISYLDASGNALLDAGDSFTLEGLANRTSVSFSVNANASRGYQSWVTGYGPIVGWLPTVTFAVTGGPVYSIGAQVSHWHEELAIGRTLSVTLRENGSPVIQDVPLVDGLVGSFPSGGLAWADLDGDGFLSSGDTFTLQGQAGTSYELDVSLLFGARTYRATAPP